MYISKKKSGKVLLKELIEDKDTYIVPGVYNPFTALLAEKKGFKAVYLSGAALTGSLAMPDLGLITLMELTYFTSMITRVINIPLIVDVDTGFGEIFNVMRTVKEMERVGAAAIQIEDQEMPKKCGHLTGKRLISIDDMIAKVRAAVEARDSDDFLIIARTDARGVEGLDSAINRAKRYVEAGADIIFPEALESEKEFKIFAEEVDAPLLANMTEYGKTPYMTADQFRRLGYKFVIFPVTMFRAAAKVTLDVLDTLLTEGTQVNILDKLMTREEFYRYIDYELYEEIDKKISGGK
jgi:methylisocitrate lyase